MYRQSTDRANRKHWKVKKALAASVGHHREDKKPSARRRNCYSIIPSRQRSSLRCRTGTMETAHVSLNTGCMLDLSELYA